MSVSLYFGLPGCGKTTILSKLAYDAVRDGKYHNVYSNVELNIVGVTYIDNDCIGKYELQYCLLLIDEGTLFADSRSFKSFDQGKMEYFLKHRHRHSDIVIFTQQWDGIDRKIRVITDRVYYVYKTWLTGHWISKYVRVPYGILFPDPKKTGEKLGEIIQGYCKPPLLSRIFAHLVYRPRYYRYFDSWELVPLADLPEQYCPVQLDYESIPIVRRYIRMCVAILWEQRTAMIKWRFTHAKAKCKRFVARVGSLLRIGAASAGG